MCFIFVLPLTVCTFSKLLQINASTKLLNVKVYICKAIKSATVWCLVEFNNM